MSEVKYAIAILKEKLANADRHNLAYQRLSIADMEAIWGTLEKSDKDCAALKTERDALAAENVVLISAFMPKEIPTEATDNFSDTAVLRIDGDEFHSWQWVDNQDEVIRGVLNFFKPKTPATDAYLNTVRAEGALLVAERMRKARYVFKEMHHGVVSECADIAVDVAKKLRAGEPS